MYKYRISKGKKGFWSAPSLNHFIDLNLGPGNYILEVEAFDGAKWHPLTSSIKVKIDDPWWRQTWVLFLTAIAILGGLYLYSKYRIEKYRKSLFVKQQITELESRALRSQMNPHFIFNCLNAIQECVVTGQIESAYTYLSKFSRLLRLVLEYSDKTEILLQQEIEILELYITLEKLRFKDDIQIEIHVDNKIDLEDAFIPPMLIQPHIENAITHGLRNKTSAKNLCIEIMESGEDYLLIKIADNGVGRQKALEMKSMKIGFEKNHTSKGLEIFDQRISILQTKFSNATWTIKDIVTTDGHVNGTLVEMHIPLLTPVI